MDISSLTGLLGNTPSLLDYLDGGKLSGTSATDPALQILGNSLQGGGDTGSGDTVSLSAEAQQLLAQLNGTAGTTDSSTANGVIKQAQNFIAGFFTDNGVDTTKLSDDAQKLLQGFQDLIGDSGATQRDATTDMQENKYNNGTRQVYTLVGDNRRIRLTITSQDGKPSELSITDISSDGEVDSAVVSLTQKDGKADGINVAETQSQYTSGMLTDTLTKPAMLIGLYS